MENNKVLNAFLDDKKSATGFKKDMLKELNKLTKDMSDEELSSIIYTDKLKCMQDCKLLQRVLDSYAFVFRYKSINEQMKFFLNIHLAEEDRTEINYLRYLIINRYFCNVYNKNTLQINKNHKFKNYLDRKSVV